MKQLLKRFSRVADSSTAAPPYVLLRPRRERRRAAGQVPVYVGEEMERFSVSADIVNHPVFEKLLRRSAEEYGYHQAGVIRIPCPASDFQRLLDALRHGGPDEVFDLVDSLSPPAATPEKEIRWEANRV